MAETILKGPESEVLSQLVSLSGAIVEIWTEEKDKSQRLAAKTENLELNFVL